MRDNQFEGHSGYGGTSRVGTTRGLAYGLLKTPTTLGSGGGSTSYVSGGNGGGAIKLVIIFKLCNYSLP